MSRLLVLRADATPHTGAGHLMRALALGQAWRSSGGEALLIGRCPNPALVERIKAAGLGLAALAPESSPEIDAARTAEAARDAAWVYVDGYDFSADYLKSLSESSARLAVADDTGDRQPASARLVINPNPGADERRYAAEDETLVLLGARYALLQAELRGALRETTRVHPAAARRVVVSFGGSDPGNLTPRVAAALAGLEGFEIIVAVGPDNPREAQVRAAAAGAAHIEVRRAPDLSSLMAWADVGVFAAGVTCLEAACLSLPTILFVTADNQAGSARALGAGGVAVLAESPETLVDLLGTLMADAGLRRRMGDAGRALCDGLGASRVAAAMKSIMRESGIELRLRPARADDALQIWSIANERAVRAHSFKTEPISLDEHRSWFAGQLRRPDTRYWVLDCEGTLASQVRYSKDADGRLEVHFSVRGAFRGRGLGSRLLADTARAACEQLGARMIRGYVIQPNVASERTFEKAGYRRARDAFQNGRSCSIFELAC